MTTIEAIDAGRVAAVSALFDAGGAPVSAGDELPALWHWAAIPRWGDSSSLGTDGHAKAGNFMPPIPHPRRMFAGGDTVIHSAPEVGTAVSRTSVVESVEHKTGRHGPLAVVRVRTDLASLDGLPLVTERQDLIYLPRRVTGPDTLARQTSESEHLVGVPLEKSDGVWRFSTDPTVLMRFSAATANAHRIHYDLAYATQVEGYPGLVVHGPLVVLALLESVRIDNPEALISRVRYRNLNPWTCGETAVVRSQTTLEPPGSPIELSLIARDDRSIVEVTVDVTTRPGEEAPHA